MAYHRHVLERFRSVSNERDSPQWRTDASALNAVALRRRENEVARGDVHLASAESPAVDAVRNRPDDLFRIVLASEHEGIGHARHGNMLITLAAPVAGRR